MLEQFTQWFLSDLEENIKLLFSILVFLFGSGLLLKLFSVLPALRDRRRINVRILGETFGDGNEIVLKFEAENLGEKTTSLKPTILVQAITPKREKQRMTLILDGEDRNLPSLTPKIFTARTLASAVYQFCWYKQYRFSLTRGGGDIIRYRNAENEEITFLKFWYEYIFFRYFGKLVNH